MTQKELLYVEDAIGHENSLMKICEDIKENLDDENLISFMEDEISKHQELHDRLLKLLKENANG